MRALALTVAASLAASAAVPARAGADESGFDVRVPLDSGLTATALVGSLLFMFVPVDRDRVWERELLPVDLCVRDNFSASAAKLSDGFVALALVSPLVAELGGGVDEAYSKRTILYGEALGASLLLNSAVKYAVQRPRPYVYNPDPRVRRWAKAQGADSRLSFYSAHASMTFTAAVAGSYLFARQAGDDTARAALWGIEMTFASAAANLRVRAGKHYYSDVILGALLGAGTGYLIPAIRDDAGFYRPSTRELVAIGGGLVLGTVGSQLLPLDDDVLASLGGVQVVPVAWADGAGLLVGASY